MKERNAASAGESTDASVAATGTSISVKATTASRRVASRRLPCTHAGTAGRDFINRVLRVCETCCRRRVAVPSHRHSRLHHRPAVGRRLLAPVFCRTFACQGRVRPFFGSARIECRWVAFVDVNAVIMKLEAENNTAIGFDRSTGALHGADGHMSIGTEQGIDRRADRAGGEGCKRNVSTRRDQDISVDI